MTAASALDAHLLAHEFLEACLVGAVLLDSGDAATG
jgi:hypothetical protein